MNEKSPKPNRPLWLFLCEPGLADLLKKELVYRKIIARKTRITILHLRHYDALIVPDVQMVGSVKTSRLALHVLICPVFGHSKVSDRQVSALIAACQREKPDGLVSSVAGSAFNRQDLTRWVEKRLRDHRISFKENHKRPLWLIVVDQAYYFCFPKFNHHELAGRTSEREGALPGTIASAMLFAAEPKSDDVIWDLTTGSGTLLVEAAAINPHASLIGTDIDKSAIDLAKRRLKACKQIMLAEADARNFDPSGGGGTFH